MIRYFKIGWITILLLLLRINGEAQQTNVIIFKDGNGIHLRWDIDPDAEGYHVYRKTGNGDWTRITTDPIRVITGNTEIKNILGTKASVLLGVFGATDRNADLSITSISNASQDPDQFKLIKALSLVNPEFADVLALRYFDRSDGLADPSYLIKSISDGRETNWAETGMIQTDEADVIPEVEKISGVGEDNAVFLSWKKDIDAIKKGEIVTYHVYRSSSELGAFARVNYYGILPGKAGSSGSLNGDERDDIQHHSDKSLENGTSYFYFVRAVNAFGMEGPPSLTIEVVPGNSAAPSPPYGIEVKQSGKAAMLTWKHDDDLLKGFEISRSVRADGDYDLIHPSVEGVYTSLNTHLDFNLSPGLIYYYKLRSVNSANIKGPWSTAVEFINWDKIPPSAPTGLKAETDNDGRITISWNPSEEEDVIGYHIDRATDNNYDWQFRLNMKMLADTFYVDQRPEVSQTTYGYVVYAVDRSLNISPSSEMVKARLPDIVPPQAPIFTALRQRGDTIELEWTKSVEEDVENFNVYRTDGRSTAYKNIGSSDSNSFLDVLPDHGTFLYRVTAVDQDANESDMSDLLSTTYQPSPYPDSPLSGRITVEDGKVLISWNAPDDDRVQGYLISRYTGNSTDRKDIAQRKLTDELEFADKYVVPGRTYTYEVRSHDKDWQLSIPITLTITLE